MRAVIASLVLSLAIIAAEAGAAVLFKLVDPSGQITYTDLVPRGFEGTVTRIDVDTNASAVSPERIAEVLAQAPFEYDLLVRRRGEATGEERLRLAQQRVDAARAALDDARNNSLAEDWYYFPRNPETGASRAPRPEYLARLNRLEANLIAAEEALSAVQREFR
jgi:hypothetical protein